MSFQSVASLRRLTVIAVLGVALMHPAVVGASGSGGDGVALRSFGLATLAPCESEGSALYPCDPSVSTSFSSSGSQEFAIYNNTGATQFYTFEASRSGEVTSVSLSQLTLEVPAYSIGNVTLTWQTSGTAGSGTATLAAFNPGMYMTSTVNVSVFIPLEIDAGFTNNDFQSADLCAVSCFAARYVAETTPFFTLDSPRLVRLVYNGDRAFPQPFVYADLSPDPARPVSRYAMQVSVNGSLVTFVNGDQTLHFSGGGSRVRLVGQFDARGYGTDVLPMTIIVVATHTDGSETRSEVTTELMNVNFGDSYVAKGWGIAGLQKLYGATAGGYLVVNGDGSATRFTGLDAVARDFTRLTFDGTRYVRHYPDASQVHFDSQGKMLEAFDPEGRLWSFYYDEVGRLNTINDPMRNVGSSVPLISVWYDANGLSTIAERLGTGPDRITSVSVAADRTLRSITDPDTRSSSFAYDGSLRLAAVTDRRGAVTDLGYDGLTWKLTTVTLPQVEVDAGGGNTTPTRPVVTLEPWQSVGLPRNPTSAGSPAAVIAPTDTRAVIRDPLSRTSVFTPDRWGQPLTSTDPLNRVTTITRSGFLPVRIVTPDGAIDSLAYDRSGRVIMSQPSGREKTFFTYKGPRFQLDSVKGPGSRNEVRSFNASGQLATITYPGSSGFLAFAFDSRSRRVSSVTDQLGHETSYAYDPQTGNLSKTTRPGNRADSATFDPHGRVATQGATGTSIGRVEYDVVNRPERLYDGVYATPTRLEYDALFQTRLIDPRGNAYQTDWNALGWATRQCDASAACSTARYDAAAQPTSYTNRRGQLVTRTFDAGGRLRSKAGTNTRTDSLSYSSDGRIVVAWNQVQRDSMFSDPGHQSAEATDSTVTWIDGKRFRVFHRWNRGVSGSDNTEIISNTGVSFLARRQDWASDGRMYAYADGFNTTNFIHAADGVREATLAPYGRRDELATTLHGFKQVGFDNGTLNQSFYRSYHYDLVGRVDAMHNASSGATRWSFGYDQLGRITQRVTDGNCNFLSDDANSGYTYDCTSAISTEAFAYDSAGNRTDLGAVTGTGNRLSSFNGIALSYDADGNVVQKYKAGSYTRNYFWSAEAQLDSAVHDNWSRVRYDYNALGQPVRKWRGDPNGMYVDRYFLWDGDQLLAELDGNGQRVAEYHYYPGTIDAPFAAVVGATSPTAIRYHQQDELGNVIGHSEGTSVNQTVSYDAWGTPTISISSDSRLFWKGLMWEGDVVSLHYMRNRWYDPETGRFMSEDPIGHAGGINLYAFAGNDPVNAVDPYGLIPCTAELEAQGYTTTVGSNGGTWCVAPAQLPTVHITGGGPEPTNAGQFPGEPNTGGNWTTAGAGGGSGGRGTGSSNISADANRRFRAVPGCVASHYGLGDLAIRTVSWLGAAPVDKAAHGYVRVYGASQYTNRISHHGRQLFPGLKVGRQVLGSNRVFGVLGRTNLLVAGGLAGYDLGSIGSCALAN